MNFDNIVEVTKPLTIIGGGAIYDGDFELARAIAPAFVAADGGADSALAAGVSLLAVIGDMDSISDAARARIPNERFHNIPEQDSTDFDKVLRSVDAPLILAVGFSGGRIDHALATMNTLARRIDQQIVLLTEHDVVFHCPKSISFCMTAGCRVSLFPMTHVTGRSNGLYWPIEGVSFAPAARSGTSNRATGDVTLEMDAPGMLCILPRAFIQPVVSALLALPEHARWRAPSG